MADGMLKQLVSRIERLEQEKTALLDDIKQVYSEAKSNGFDTKALRQVIKIRAQDKVKAEEMQATIDLYMKALGDLATTPLGQAAISARKEGK